MTTAPEDDPLDALMRQAFCGQAWLADRLLRRALIAGEPTTALDDARDHAEVGAVMATARLGEPDPFLPSPPAPDPDEVGWFDLGFSALLLELLTRHLPAYAELSGSFGRDRRQALARAAAEGEAAVKARINAFVIPALGWGDDFLREAIAALQGRLPRRRLLTEAVAALKEAGLPDDPWDYVEPQLDRYGKMFGIGWVRKKAIKVGLWLA